MAMNDLETGLGGGAGSSRTEFDRRVYQGKGAAVGEIRV